MEVKVKTMVGKEYKFAMNSTERVYTLMQKVSEQVGIPAEQQRLVFNGKALKNEDTLENQNVVGGSTVQLLVQLR
jgi:hypothetical protein